MCVLFGLLVTIVFLFIKLFPAFLCGKVKEYVWAQNAIKNAEFVCVCGRIEQG